MLFAHTSIHSTRLLSSSLDQGIYCLHFSANTLHLSVSSALLFSFPLPRMYVPDTQKSKSCPSLRNKISSLGSLFWLLQPEMSLEGTFLMTLTIHWILLWSFVHKSHFLRMIVAPVAVEVWLIHLFISCIASTASCTHLSAQYLFLECADRWYKPNRGLFFMLILGFSPLCRQHDWCQPETAAGSRAAPQSHCHREICHCHEGRGPAPGGALLQDLPTAGLARWGIKQGLGISLQAGMAPACLAA